jgi:nicotinate dehydrogenase subunit A
MIRLNVNGEVRQVAAPPTKLLVEVLRNDLGLKGTRFGCGQGRCGACTVIVGGQAVRSCRIPAQAAVGQEIVTIEGLGSPEHPHPLKTAIQEAQGCQCGHCGTGMILAAKAFLDRTPRPTEAQIRELVMGHECMCGSRSRVVKAVMRVAGGAARR